MDTILAAFIASAIGQIEILAFNLQNFDMLAERRRRREADAGRGVAAGKGVDAGRGVVARPDDYYVMAVLKDCIKHHNSIISYVALIERAFSLASVLQLMLSAMVLCLVGVQFLSIENPASHPMQIMWMVIYLSCMLIEVFILCWFGDDLIWKSSSLRQAAFDGPWRRCGRRPARCVLLLMTRCQRPLAVTAGKIFPLSLQTYTVLINWSYKAFAVMSNMKT
ncbi:hypothetical protein JYU34_015587 [Plutella xylostella]|uniref:Odorant receptor n=1 Tax=Plutella xylostella TaxID=51655 RepID=A0ABQ7Q4J2_PLUXY|nr:hypothetical protein JYU34_015587 [Plutella xylostella]